MPLSEDERRQLQQIERALYEDDPKFARRIRAGDPRMRYKRTLLPALLGAVIGPGLLAARAVTDRAYLEAAGLAIVLLSLVATMISHRRYLAGPGPRVRGGDQDGDGHETPARAEQAGPDDGPDGRALPPAPGR